MKLAIIGGSLVKDLSELADREEEQINTPFGAPSDAFVSGNIGGLELVFINRHGFRHNIAPHQVNYRANMFVLKMLEVTDVIAVTAVGGITENMSPNKWVLPDQIIDYTHGRMQTYNDADDNGVKHIDFSYPFDAMLSVKLGNALTTAELDFETSATYGATQGPRLETVAEIQRMKRDGCDIVGMTAMPEAALARELEMNYAGLSLVVNWAAGIGAGTGDSQASAGKIINMDEVHQLIQQGNANAEKVIKNFIRQL